MTHFYITLELVMSKVPQVGPLELLHSKCGRANDRHLACQSHHVSFVSSDIHVCATPQPLWRSLCLPCSVPAVQNTYCQVCCKLQFGICLALFCLFAFFLVSFQCFATWLLTASLLWHTIHILYPPQHQTYSLAYYCQNIKHMARLTVVSLTTQFAIWYRQQCQETEQWWGQDRHHPPSLRQKQEAK